MIVTGRILIRLRMPLGLAITLGFLCVACSERYVGAPSPSPLDRNARTADAMDMPASDSRPTKVSPQSEADRIAQEFIDSGGQFTDTVASCSEILMVEPWCGVIGSAIQVSKPEWELLFPAADFFIARRVVYGGEIQFQSNLLVVEQDQARYDVKSFQSLLDANNVDVSAENLEIIARSLALMMLPDFIEYEVEFTSWEEGDWRSPIRVNYSHRLTAWTELGGLEVTWLFLYYEGELLGAEGWVADEAVGVYIAIPEGGPIQPSQGQLAYWNR